MYKQAIYYKTAKFYEDYWGALSNWEIDICGTFLDRNIQYRKTRFFFLRQIYNFNKIQIKTQVEVLYLCSATKQADIKCFRS